MDSDDAEQDSFFFPSSSAVVKRRLQRDDLHRKDVQSFGVRHALACVLDFDAQGFQVGKWTWWCALHVVIFFFVLIAYDALTPLCMYHDEC